jgi:hypothetical protein
MVPQDDAGLLDSGELFLVILLCQQLKAGSSQLLQLEAAMQALAGLSPGHARLQRFRVDLAWVKTWAEQGPEEAVRAAVERLLANAIES